MSRITLLEQMLERDDVDDEQAYSLECQLFGEYRSFRFDDAVTTLKRTLRLAEKMQSAERKRETSIRLANLYTNAGMYIEANAILSHAIDTVRIDRNGLRDYYLARRRLCYEIYDHSKEPELAEAAWRQYNYYVSLLFGSGKENLFNDNFAMSNARLSHLIHIYCYAEAEELAKKILSQCDDYSHRYAIVAYKLATIYEQTQQHEKMLEWYTRSATADILTATKDNASMCCLANHLFGRNDVQRAFHYIRLSMDDAIFYNSKLRPWQVAQSMSNIEGVAADMEANRLRLLRNSVITISILLLVVVAVLVYMFHLLRQVSRNRHTLHSRAEQIEHQNEELLRLNRAIIESNHVKEEYIGLFLSICSEYIDRFIDYQRNVRRKLSAGKGQELLKEVSSSQEIIDAETKRFYKIFDNAFLSLYPTFVEDFNSLLVESERIEPHKGEMLNTELRIFALIRLGITDSSKIASLLRYSVNTIYNYRAKVKNKARSTRDDFEERVKHIGSFMS